MENNTLKKEEISTKELQNIEKPDPEKSKKTLIGPNFVTFLLIGIAAGIIFNQLIIGFIVGLILALIFNHYDFNKKKK